MLALHRDGWQRIEKLQACLHLIGQPSGNRHIVFEDPEYVCEGVSE